uniref:Cytochrome P450 n=1 Tax=Clastoptera arizonana TaxID=38151 RepID=A0A1B6DS13_9HEMI
MEFVLDTLSLTLCLVVVFVTSLYMYGTRTFNYWKVRGIPYLKPLPFVGTQLFMFTNSASHIDYYSDIYKQYDKERYVGLFQFQDPQLFVRDPKMINDILISNFNDFHDRGLYTNFKLNPLNATLLRLEGSMWRNLRKKSSPVFTVGKLKTMIGEVEKIALDLVRLMEKKTEESACVDVRELAVQFTTKAIGSVAFGVDLDTLDDPESEFVKKAANVFGYTARRVTNELLSSVHPKLTTLLGLKSFDPKVERFYLDFVKDAVAYRENHNYQRNDFLQLLINLRKDDVLAKPSNDVVDSGYENSDFGDKEVVLDDKLLAANVFIFFIAGFDTTSTSLSHCLLELAVNPDIQEKTRQEILAMTKDTEKLTYEVIQSMKYLDQVISENLRKNSPVVNIFRKVTNPYQIPGTDVVLDKEVNIYIPIYAIHNDPKYYPEPHRFDPDRFSEENAANLNNGTYLPFGDGPRICIGKRFALMELKVALIHLLTRFKFGVTEKTEYPLEYRTGTMFLIPKGGIWLKVEKILK